MKREYTTPEMKISVMRVGSVICASSGGGNTSTISLTSLDADETESLDGKTLFSGAASALKDKLSAYDSVIQNAGGTKGLNWGQSSDDISSDDTALDTSSGSSALTSLGNLIDSIKGSLSTNTADLDATYSNTTTAETTTTDTLTSDDESTLATDDTTTTNTTTETTTVTETTSNETNTDWSGDNTDIDTSVTYDFSQDTDAVGTID